MFLSEYLMDAMVNGREGGRIGNRHPYRAPQGAYPAQGDDEWIALSVADQAQWLALCNLMERGDLASDPRFGTLRGRQQNHDEIDDAISNWTRCSDKYDLMHRLQSVGIASGPVLSGKDVHFDPHYRSRNFLERVEFPEERDMGTRIIMGRPYRMSKTPLKVRGPAPMFGQDNRPLLEALLGKPRNRLLSGKSNPSSLRYQPQASPPRPWSRRNWWKENSWQSGIRNTGCVWDSEVR